MCVVAVGTGRCTVWLLDDARCVCWRVWCNLPTRTELYCVCLYGMLYYEIRVCELRGQKTNGGHLH